MLKHVFRVDPATLDRYGIRCLHCGGRRFELCHLGWAQEIKYDWRFMGTFDHQKGRWRCANPLPVQS